MRPTRFLLLMMAAAALSSAAPARAALDVYAPVPSRHWAYGSVQRLEQTGLHSGSPAGTFISGEELTRYDFASAVQRLYRGIQLRVLAADSAGTLSDDLKILGRLLDEFSGDLILLGEDVAVMRGQMQQMALKVDHLAGGQAPQPAPAETRGPARIPGLALSLGSPPPRARSSARPSLAPKPAQPGLAAALGSALVEFQTERRTGVTAPADLPFYGATALDNYRLHVSGNLLGSVRGSAFLEQQGLLSGVSDPWDPTARLGGTSGAGAGISTPVLFTGLQFQLEGASLRAIQDDLSRMSYFRGSLRYNLNPDLRVSLGAQYSRYMTAGAAMGTMTYTLAFEKALGANTRLGLLFRYSGDGGAQSAGSTAADGASSAVGQFSVRF